MSHGDHALSGALRLGEQVSKSTVVDAKIGLGRFMPFACRSGMPANRALPSPQLAFELPQSAPGGIGVLQSSSGLRKPRNRTDWRLWALRRRMRCRLYDRFGGAPIEAGLQAWVESCLRTGKEEGWQFAHFTPKRSGTEVARP